MKKVKGKKGETEISPHLKQVAEVEVNLKIWAEGANLFVHADHLTL